MQGIRWCAHCGRPHPLTAQFCSLTGERLNRQIHKPEQRPTPVHVIPPPLAKQRRFAPGVLLANRYRIVRQLGRGGNGEVFEAEDVQLERHIAIKVVSRQNEEAAADRLRREALAIAALRHENVCDLFDIGTLPDGSPYLVLELLVGSTLGELLQKRRRLPLGEAKAIFLQILSALHATHSTGIIHRDLKPANVFLTSSSARDRAPVVKVLDFGFAKRAFGLSDRTLTRPGHACGTPQYMSPEQLRAEPLDGRSDLFSVAVMLFETLTGSHPFRAASMLDVAKNIIGAPTPHASRLCASLDGAVDALLARGLAKRASERFGSALDFQHALGVLDDDEDAPTLTHTLKPSLSLPSLAASSSVSVLSASTSDEESTTSQTAFPRVW